MNSVELSWPGGYRIAVAVTVMFETWADGKAPTYSVQTTHLKPGTEDHAGKAWSTYGGRVGAWRIVRALDRQGVPATFFTNAHCAELYPDAVAQIVRSGHDIGGHAHTQDQLLAYMTADEQCATIRNSIDLLEEKSGRRPTGWLSPVLAFTPDTVDHLKAAGLNWHADVTYHDLPHVVRTKNGPLGAVPNSDFTDNRVLRSNPRDLFDLYSDTFDYLYRNEPMSMLVLTLHCHFGGRPMVIAQFERILQYFKQYPGVWFARHEELANWALARDGDDCSYAERYFDPSTASNSAAVA